MTTRHVVPAGADRPGNAHRLVFGPGWVTAGVAAAAGVMVAAIAGWVALRATGTTWHMIDLAVYRWGGELARSHGDLYGSIWDGSLITGYTDDPLAFTYPPFAAVLFIPISLVGITTAQVAAVVATVAALAVTIRTGLVTGGWARTRSLYGAVSVFTALALLSEPVTQTLLFGQINPILMAVVVVDLCSRDDRPLKGIGVGIAAGVKLTPGIFVLYLLVTRRLRAAAVATAAFAGTILAGSLVAPEASRVFWLDRPFLDPERTGTVSLISNQSLTGALERLFGSSSSTLALGLGLTVTAVALLAARHLSRRGRELDALCACAVGGLWLSPISWSHHWVWMVPLCVAVFTAAVRGRARTACICFLVGAALVFSTVPLFPGTLWFLDRLDLPGMTALTAGLYPLMAAAGIAILVAAAPRVPADRSPADGEARSPARSSELAD